jgi:hypothetical protein
LAGGGRRGTTEGRGGADAAEEAGPGAFPMGRAMTPPAASRSPSPGRRPRQLRLRTLMILVAGAALGCGALRIPEVGELVRFLGLLLVAGVVVVLILLVGTVAVLLVAMALAWLGFGLFTLFDRLWAWARRPASEPAAPTTGGTDPELARGR